MEWKCTGISGAKQKVVTRNSQSIKVYILFEFLRVSPGDQPLTKKPEDYGIEIGLLLRVPKIQNLDVQKIEFTGVAVGTSFHPQPLKFEPASRCINNLQ